MAEDIDTEIFFDALSVLLEKIEKKEEDIPVVKNVLNNSIEVLLYLKQLYEDTENDLEALVTQLRVILQQTIRTSDENGHGRLSIFCIDRETEKSEHPGRPRYKVIIITTIYLASNNHLAPNLTPFALSLLEN
jgi:uncharacterized protein (UPF0128 family)